MFHPFEKILKHIDAGRSLSSKEVKFQLFRLLIATYKGPRVDGGTREIDYLMHLLHQAKIH